MLIEAAVALDTGSFLSGHPVVVGAGPAQLSARFGPIAHFVEQVGHRLGLFLPSLLHGHWTGDGLPP